MGKPVAVKLQKESESIVDAISLLSEAGKKRTEIYNANGFDIALVQRLLQHSSATTTQRYIGIEPQKIEQAIQNHANLT